MSPPAWQCFFVTSRGSECSIPSISPTSCLMSSRLTQGGVLQSLLVLRHIPFAFLSSRSSHLARPLYSFSCEANFLRRIPCTCNTPRSAHTSSQRLKGSELTSSGGSVCELIRRLFGHALKSSLSESDFNWSSRLSKVDREALMRLPSLRGVEVDVVLCRLDLDAVFDCQLCCSGQ